MRTDRRFDIESRLPAAILALGMVVAQSLIAATAADWPQFLGPQRNGSYSGPPLARTWPTDGPPILWKRTVGAGFAGPAVSQERLIVFHRLGDQAVVECLEARTGKEIWKASYPTDYQDDFGFDNGPRATPSVADGRVFTFGAEGGLHCWNLTNGEALWSIDTAKEFDTRKGYFGRACSPLVWSNLVIVTVGGPAGAGIVAFDVTNGKVRWKATDDEASYSSPTVASIHGQACLLALTREALVSLHPADGRIVFRYPWRPPMGASVTSATPLVVDDLIFLSASYGAGARLLRFQETGPDLIWSQDDVLSNHYATSVERQGFLYGWHGRQEQGCDFRCVELKTGKMRWTQPGLRAGTVTLVQGELLLLTERGELLRLPASPDGFKTTARVQVLPSGVRAPPALANGLFYGRSENRLVCLDLTQER
jgi:outer membrane protein assembly factor BamB